MRTNYTDPYEWFHITDAFDNYQDILDNLPGNDEYEQYKTYPKRFLYSCKDSFWSSIVQSFKDLLGPNTRVQLCRDFEGYSIGPHTDGSEKSTILYYLARDDKNPHLGTSIYVPKEEGFTCDGKKHHPVNKFNKVKTVPYLPNTGFGFIRSNNSFHGVETTDSVRDVLQISIHD